MRNETVFLRLYELYTSHDPGTRGKDMFNDTFPFLLGKL